MNTNVTTDTKFWTFIVAAFIFVMITILVIFLEAMSIPRGREDIEAGKTRQNSKDARFFRSIWNWLGTHQLVYNGKRLSNSLHPVFVGEAGQIPRSKW
jgi:hypothetical protein